MGVGSQGVGVEAGWVKWVRWGSQSVGSGASLCSGDWLPNSTESLRNCMKYGIEPSVKGKERGHICPLAPSHHRPKFLPQMVNSPALWGCACMNTKCVVGVPASVSVEKPGIKRDRH